MPQMPLNILNPIPEKAEGVNGPRELGSTAIQTVTQSNVVKSEKPALSEKTKKRNKEFREKADLCKVYRRKLIGNWATSIDYRRGKPFTSQTDDDQVAVNLDWTYTKAKHAALFSQVPQVRISHTPETLPKVLPWVSTFERTLNDRLVEAGIEATMEECLPDCINAAGIGVAIVSYECLTEDREVPLKEGEEATETVPNILDKRYLVSRLSPCDLLWPLKFLGSDFNRAPWIGRSGSLTWPEAMRRFSLKESDKETVLGEERPIMDKLSHDIERDRAESDEIVSFDEIFYRENVFEQNPTSYGAIHHLVFVGGKDDPVVDESWKGQKIGPDGSVVGSTKFPIQVLTLTYITDEAIPPSDSAISRPQINEINKGRTQQIQQRQRSLPVRWIDINRTDSAIAQSLMRGTWQSFIPVQGDGQRIIGEVSRATMPPENYKFDEVAKKDALHQWSFGIADEEKSDEQKADPNQNTSGFNTQIGRERARVGSFFCALAEILGGLMCLYEDPATFGEGFDPNFSKVLKFSIMTDSTVLLDAGQRLARLSQFVETHAKSGWVNIEPVMQEIATLVGLDASIAIRPPQPKPPEVPNISLRLTGIEDLLNPMALAILLLSGQGPTPELIEKAKQLIQQSVVPPQPPPGQETPPGVGQDGQAISGQQMPQPQPGPQPGSPLPQPAPPGLGEANPEWTNMPTLGKRTEGNQK